MSEVTVKLQSKHVDRLSYVSGYLQGMAIMAKKESINKEDLAREIQTAHDMIFEVRNYIVDQLYGKDGGDKK